MNEHVEEPKIDKSKWPDGPWKAEPDRVQWQHAGYACLIVRNRLGALCGYVGVDNTHPAYGKEYGDVNVEVHGGLTYSDRCTGAICHVPEAGMPDDVWWLGFDCAHLFDLVPAMFRVDLGLLPAALVSVEARHLREDVYRDVSYVRKEVESLAEQLRACIDAE